MRFNLIFGLSDDNGRSFWQQENTLRVVSANKLINGEQFDFLAECSVEYE